MNNEDEDEDEINEINYDVSFVEINKDNINDNNIKNNVNVETELLEEINKILNKVMIEDLKKIENKEKEIIKFYYFSELETCGVGKLIHQKYCDKMIDNGYSLEKIIPLGNLDIKRDSYEGTLIYHWKIQNN
jgi:hypothetical protein